MRVNTMMREMQAIEEAASALRQDYQAQVQALEQVKEEELEDVKHQFSEVTRHLVSEEEARLSAQLQAAQETLSATQAASQLLVDQALASQRQRWIDHIIEKVVDNYGR